MTRELEERPVDGTEFCPVERSTPQPTGELNRAAEPAPRPDAAGRSFVVVFFDRFLQEQNIKWILVTGVLILLASSIKLVDTLWDDSTASVKQLILLGYAAGFFGLSQAAYWRLALRKTGTVLMTLTVLLVPIAFVGLHWVFTNSSGGLWALSRNLALLGGTAALGWFASQTIFTHFLRKPQPTFVACYVLLSAAAAFVPTVPAGWWPFTTFALWSVFAIGTVKVNRHVFWMAEECRLPRILGFFPIALLATQFVWLFLWQVGPNVPREWLGLILVMVAVPILLTADAVARVFEERTGNLVRPLPWAVVGPMLVALALCAVGMALTFTGLPLPTALVPTALLTAVVLGTVAYRTGNQRFVWAALACIVLAYNFSYVFILDVVRYLQQSGAAAVREQRLPYAFYGLTYLPLLTAMVVSAWGLAKARAPMPFLSRIRDLWCGPLQKFVAGLCVVLLAAAYTHSKALLPVAAVICAAFLFQAVLFGSPRLIVPAILAYLSAIAGVAPFCSNVLDISLSGDAWVIIWTIAATGLLGPGHLLDRWGSRQRVLLTTGGRSDNAGTPARNRADIPWCRLSSQGVSLVIAAISIARLLPSIGVATNVLPVAFAATLLMTHALVAALPRLGLITLCYAGGAGLLLGFIHRVPLPEISNWLEGSLLTLWIGSYLLDRVPEWRVTRAFGSPSRRVSLVALTVVAGYHLITLMTGLVYPDVVPSVLGTLALFVWGVDASRRTGLGAWAGISCTLLFALAGSVWIQTAPPGMASKWLVTVWSTLGLGLVPILRLLQRRIGTSLDHCDDDGGPHSSRWVAILAPVEFVTFSVLAVIAVGSLVWLTVPLRVAGGFAALAWGLHGVLSRRRELLRGALVLVNWQLLCLVLWLSVPEARFLTALDQTQLQIAAIPVAAAAATSLFLVSGIRIRNRESGGKCDDLLEGHGSVLQVLTIGALFWAGLRPILPLSPLDVVLVGAAFGALIGESLWLAVAGLDEMRVWWAEALAGLAGLFLWRCGVIEFGHGFAMFVILAIGLIAWTIGRLSMHAPRTAILSRPLTRMGSIFPLVTVAIGIARSLGDAAPLWLGANSLTIFIAAAFYFWRGIEERDKRLTILATAIVNVSLGLLWRELEFSDPQFFMIPLGLSVIGIVELLRDEIPQRFHDPLRYIGALTILVSPTFHIVEGSWLHLATLMVAAVVVCLLAIGLEVRALIYAGTAFLMADLVAIVIRGGIDRPNILWIAGVAFGTIVIVLGAICEKHREDVLQRLRILSARLETWH